MTAKRKASDGLVQPCSRNVESIDEDEKVVCNESICETKNEHGNISLCGILSALSSQTTKSGAIFVLEKASLVLAHVGKRYQILSSDDHADYLRKKKLNPYDYRPDIVHEALLLIWESRLHILGRVKAVYICTDDGALIKVEPNTQIPESLTEFCHMMAMLRQKLCIKAKGKRGKLLRLVDNPITKHLPVNSRKIGLSFSSQKSVEIEDYVSGISCQEDVVFVVGTMAYGKIESNYIEDLISGLSQSSAKIVDVNHYLSAAKNDSVLCFVVGAMAKGKINKDGMDDYIAVSNLPLSARYCTAIIRQALEDKWKACESKESLQQNCT